MVVFLADAAALADFHRHGPADHVAAGQVLGVGGITLHEAFALGIGQIAALSARALGDQAAGSIDAGGVELNEFHVLQGQAGARHHAVAVAGAGVRRGAREIRPAIAAGGQDGGVGAEPVQGAVIQVPGHHAPAGAVLVHDQVEGEELDKELRLVLQRLLIERVQYGMAGAVGRRAGALHRGLAEVAHVAAEGALIDAAVLGARERHAEVFQFVHRRNGLAAHVFDGVLVAEPVGALDGVVHVPLPLVLGHVAERRANPALGGDGVGTGGKDLGQAGGLQAFGHGAEGGAQAGAAGADNDNIVIVVDERGGSHGPVTLQRPG